MPSDFGQVSTTALEVLTEEDLLNSDTSQNGARVAAGLVRQASDLLKCLLARAMSWIPCLASLVEGAQSSGFIVRFSVLFTDKIYGR